MDLMIGPSVEVDPASHYPPEVLRRAQACRRSARRNAEWRGDAAIVPPKVPLRSVHRRIHDEVFRRLIRCEFFDHSALAADQYSVGHSHNLRQVGRDDHHRFARIGKAIDNFVDFGDRANIYATSSARRR